MLARQLFWMHMVQHLLLMVVAAPLLALASPWTRLWRALPLVVRRSVARPVFLHPGLAPLRWLYQQVARPGVIWVLAAANLWLWHLPQIYNLTLTNHTVHHFEHALFLGLGIAFWAHVVDQHPFRAPLGTLARAAFVFLAMVQSWGLAAILSFATGPFYAYQQLPSRPGGISALTDQQLGGGMMWVPGAITYSIVFIALLFRWLAEEDLRALDAQSRRARTHTWPLRHRSALRLQVARGGDPAGRGRLRRPSQAADHPSTSCHRAWGHDRRRTRVAGNIPFARFPGGGALAAGGAGAINCWFDRDIDALMPRTRRRAIAAGSIAPAAGLAFGIIVALAGVALVALSSNLLAAALAAAGGLVYVFVYTMWLKRTTPQNIVIGGAGRLSAAGRLGRGHGFPQPAGLGPVRDHLLLDAATLLGAGARPAPAVRR